MARSISCAWPAEETPSSEHPLHDGHHQSGHLGPELLGRPPGGRLDVGAGPAHQALVLLLALLAQLLAQLFAHPGGLVLERPGFGPALLEDPFALLLQLVSTLGGLLGFGQAALNGLLAVLHGAVDRREHPLVERPQDDQEDRQLDDEGRAGDQEVG